MRRQLLILAFGCTMAAQAQKAPVFETSAKDEIAANRYLAGSNYLDYDRQLPTGKLTPAPKNYEPFYMSHYGRHGSRWLINENDYRYPINTLRDARQQGKLTPVGLETLKKLETFYPTTVKRLGELTTVGERQHHGIGRRMAEHFPELFKTRNLDTIFRASKVLDVPFEMLVGYTEEPDINQFG